MSARSLLVAALGLVLSLSPAAGQQSAGKDEADIARWIKQLGSSRFREREAATAALTQRRSPQVLAALRQAATMGDPEVRRRAREVLETIERLLEREQVLTPQKMRFVFKEVRLADAVAELARRSGLKIVLAEGDKNLPERKVTLDTGEVGIWEALRLLCDKAGISERPPDLNARRPMDLDEALGGRRRIVWLSHDRFPEPPEYRIVLADGKGARPMHQAGALRIQVVPKPQVGPPGREAELTLAVDLEARFNWGRLVSLRVDHALDERGQKVVQPQLTIGEQPQLPPAAEEIFIIWDGMMDFPRSAPRHGSVKLRLGDKPARMLKEVRGRMAVEVEAPPAPLLAVPDVLKTAGKTFDGPDGSRLRVLEVARDGGQYRLKIEVKMPPEPPRHPFMGGNLIWLNRGPVGEGATVNVTASDVEQKGLALYDAEGQPLLLATGFYIRTQKPDDPRLWTLYYQPRRDQGEPAKLVLSGRRHIILDVPFILKDVPLP